MDFVYSIVFYDNSGESSPQVRLFSSENDAIDSVVDEVGRFRLLREGCDYPEDNEIRTSLIEEGVVVFTAQDGIEYSWKMEVHSFDVAKYLETQR